MHIFLFLIDEIEKNCQHSNSIQMFANVITREAIISLENNFESGIINY